jgi:hypothetical protein
MNLTQTKKGKEKGNEGNVCVQLESGMCWIERGRARSRREGTSEMWYEPNSFFYLSLEHQQLIATNGVNKINHGTGKANMGSSISVK